MKRSLLMWDETLFRDPEVFEIDYVPEQFNHRDTQIRELAFQVRPGLRGGRPLNTICRGLPGTGKTTSVRKVFAEIEEVTQKLVPIYINCQIDNTKFAVFSQIYRRIFGHLPPASGVSFKQLLDAIARALQREEQVLLVGLDDANYLLYENEINHVLYSLLRSHEAYPGVRIGVVAIGDLQGGLDRVADGLGALDVAGGPVADADHVLPHRLVAELGVERRDARHGGRRDVADLAQAAQRGLGQVAVVLLDRLEQRNHVLAALADATHRFVHECQVQLRHGQCSSTTEDTENTERKKKFQQ